jgi:hypothetical protein
MRLVLILLLLSTRLCAQELTQTIRGTVSDKVSREPLTGAAVLVMDSTGRYAAMADVNGRFRIEKVPLGRQNLRISFLGYSGLQLQVVLTSTKEVIVNAELEQKVIESREVVVTGERDKARTNNEMTTVSSRSFTIEETQRYAGSLNDPARMAANYAGVSGANDARNDIIIRGNSPVGVLWRLNGIDIPNPNHFGALGTTGGPVSILNTNQLDKSDFMTGAFPAEYGNALAGVFDLQMRAGNNEKREYTAQLGFNGFELGAEGPFSSVSNGSYLVNYRYSTLSVFNTLGIDLGTGAAIPQYQDLSFRMDLPLNPRWGKLSLFGIGGLSYVELLESRKDTTKKDIYSRKREDTYYGTNMGVVGLTHTYFFSSSSYARLNLSASGAGNITRVDSVGADKTPYPFYGNRFMQGKYSVNYTLYNKLNSRNFVKSGFTVDHLRFVYKDSLLKGNAFRRLTNTEGSADFIQAYSQWQHKFSDRFLLNAGLHYQQFLLNNTFAVEPRAGLRYQIGPQVLSFGTGLHSQLQPLYTYFTQTRLADGSYIQTNRSLGFTRSMHYVLAYDRTFGRDRRIKAEAYYQHLFGVPVEVRPGYYSLINEGADFGFSGVDSLTGRGTGSNYGLELTFEKFYSDNYYLLFTTSLFSSRYKGSDGIERNTAFNGNYILNVLGGREFVFRKRNVLAFNGKVAWAGGKRYIPIDLGASQLHRDPRYDYSRAYDNQYSNYFRMDVKISFRRNGRRTTQEWSLDINNVLNSRNIFIEKYDPITNTLKREYQMGFFPIPQYKITF